MQCRHSSLLQRGVGTFLLMLGKAILLLLCSMTLIFSDLPFAIQALIICGNSCLTALLERFLDNLDLEVLKLREIGAFKGQLVRYGL